MFRRGGSSSTGPVGLGGDGRGEGGEGVTAACEEGREAGAGGGGGSWLGRGRGRGEERGGGRQETSWLQTLEGGGGLGQLEAQAGNSI